MPETTETSRHLLLRAGGRVAALRLEDVELVTRPLALEPLSDVPAWVRGASLVRGEAVPVVALGTLLGASDRVEDGGEGTSRWVVVRAGSRRAALEVARVLGIETMPVSATDGLPPLLTAASGEAVTALVSRDAALVSVLDAARLVPPEGAPEVPP